MAGEDNGQNSCFASNLDIPIKPGKSVDFRMNFNEIRAEL